MFQLVVATKNKHKLDEFQQLLKGKDDSAELKSLLDYPSCPPIEEDQDTFEGNAEKKAIEVSNYTEQPAFADDSGLEVEALNGAPGVHSARYAGEDATDKDRIEKLLKALEGVENRNAQFVCVIAVAYNGEVLQTFKGVCKGKITTEIQGENGFGYDPVFIPDGYNKTFAELSQDEKNEISHRAIAVKEAVEFFEELASSMDIF